MKTAITTNRLLGYGENFGRNLGFRAESNGIRATMGGNDPGQFQCGHIIISLENSVIIPLAYRIGLICGSGFLGLENHGSGLKSKKYNWILVMLIAPNLLKLA